MDDPDSWAVLTLGIFMALLFGSAFYVVLLFIWQARMTRRVQLYEKGLDIFKAIGKQGLSYADIKKVELLDDSALSSHRNLKLSLKDERDKELGHIKDVVENFDQLTAELRQIIGQEPEPDLGANQSDREARLKQRDKRLRFGLAMFSLLLLFLMVTIAIMFPGFEIQSELREEGVQTEAVVVKYYVDDDASHIIRYQYNDQAGQKQTRETSLPEDLWGSISEGDSLPVIYPPSAPWVGVLPFEEYMNVGRHIAILSVFAFLSAAMCILYLTGREVEYLNGKFYLVKRGELVEDKLK